MRDPNAGRPEREQDPGDRAAAASGLPSIGLVTPSYEQARFLEAALRSVLGQGYPALEYLVLDGGSTDGSVEILERHDAALDHWRSAPDDGQADAVNRGWRRATGEVLGWLNSDDLLAPGALAAVGEAFAARPGLRVVYGDCRVVDAEGREVRVERPGELDARTLLLGRSLPQPAVFLRRSLVEELGGLDASLHHALDWAFFLRAFLRTGPGERRYLPRVLAASRVYEGTKTRTGLEAKGAERRRVLRELRASGELADVPDSLHRRAVGGTWWIQAVDEWLAGRSAAAARSALRALARDPLRAVRKATSLPWLVTERLRRRRQVREAGGGGRGGRGANAAGGG